MARILHSGTRNASSWAFRAWLALKEAGIDFDEEVVDIRRPQRMENLARIRRFSPPGAVPVLVDDGMVIFDSLAIMGIRQRAGRRPPAAGGRAPACTGALAAGVAACGLVGVVPAVVVRERVLSRSPGDD